MPTPFQHLHYAQQSSSLRDFLHKLRDRLEAESGAFLLGNTAGDVQTITGQRRVETHFYSLSDLHRGPAGDRLLTAYPSLADPWSLSPAQAAFVSGYLVHLVWDEIWADDVFIPLYRDSAIWRIGSRGSSTTMHCGCTLTVSPTLPGSRWRGGGVGECDTGAMAALRS